MSGATKAEGRRSGDALSQVGEWAAAVEVWEAPAESDTNGADLGAEWHGPAPGREPPVTTGVAGAEVRAILRQVRDELGEEALPPGGERGCGGTRCCRVPGRSSSLGWSPGSRSGSQGWDPCQTGTAIQPGRPGAREEVWSGSAHRPSWRPA